jgi:2-iminobutanoate/2-iminopropanoate deaminase
LTAAPAPIGPYRPAVEAAGLVFTAGQIALDPATGRLVEGDAAAQAARAIENLRAVLEGAGTSLDRVVRVTLYLRSMADYEAVNRVYARFFPSAPPARSCVAAADLPQGALVLVDAVAVRR